jgi:hypothetical protein
MTNLEILKAAKAKVLDLLGHVTMAKAFPVKTVVGDALATTVNAVETVEQIANDIRKDLQMVIDVIEQEKKFEEEQEKLETADDAFCEALYAAATVHDPYFNGTEYATDVVTEEAVQDAIMSPEVMEAHLASRGITMEKIQKDFFQDDTNTSQEVSPDKIAIIDAYNQGYASGLIDAANMLHNQ